MNKCVYYHADKNGVPFYVGKGTIYRAFKKEMSEGNPSSVRTGRGSAYSLKVRELEFNYDVFIIKDGLTEKQATELEIEVFEDFSSKFKLTNARKPFKEVDMSKDFLEKWVKYDETSSTKLRWIAEHTFGGNRLGKDAGGPVNRGRSKCMTVRINSVAYYVHRVIMVLFGFDVKDKVVDHIDGDRSNNNISNLRVIERSDNNKNTSMHPSNSSGVSGVHPHWIRGFKRWIATWTDEFGKRRSKCFSVIKYGEPEAFKLACEYRAKQLIRLENFGIFYSKRHGLKEHQL